MLLVRICDYIRNCEIRDSHSGCAKVSGVVGARDAVFWGLVRRFVAPCALRPVHTMRHVSVPSEWSVFSHLPEQHVTGGLRLFPSNMKRHSFSKRRLATTAFMLDEEEKNAGLRDKKKRMWVFFFPDTVAVLLI